MFIYEENPIWDLNKERIIGKKVESFPIETVKLNDQLPYKWWRLEDDTNNEVLGYGWIAVDEDKNETEVSLCIAEEHRGKKIGIQILNNLEQEILVNNLPRNIIATICGSNVYAFRVVKLLLNNGYDSELPIKTVEPLINKGYDVTFIKKLN